jgi:redox-sensitive bicupin YhaK (pirin superfamily)
MHTLARHRLSPAFTSASLRPGPIPMGHLLNVDHFHMSEATFPPHPHAGFSAVTYMLPGSAGGFINRDSRGDRSRIVPGALHWTLAGAGMIHEELPEQPGLDCEGLQIFVKLPEPIEAGPPAAFHLAPEALPQLRPPGGLLRVLVGHLDGARSPIPSHARTTLLHIDLLDEQLLQNNALVTIPEGVEAFALGLRGSGAIQGTPVRAEAAVALSPGPVRLSGAGLSALIAWSDPMPTRPTFAGPFCMFRPERLSQARENFAAGAMGHLEPSPARWVR